MRNSSVLNTGIRRLPVSMSRRDTTQQAMPDRAASPSAAGTAGPFGAGLRADVLFAAAPCTPPAGDTPCGPAAATAVATRQNESPHHSDHGPATSAAAAAKGCS